MRVYNISMSKNNYVSLVSYVFLIVGVAHVLRAFSGWEVQFGSYMVPVWASYVAAVVAFCLSYQGFRLAKTQ